jgi:hypothetical protein
LCLIVCKKKLVRISGIEPERSHQAHETHQYRWLSVFYIYVFFAINRSHNCELVVFLIFSRIVQHGNIPAFSSSNTHHPHDEFSARLCRSNGKGRTYDKSILVRLHFSILDMQVSIHNVGNPTLLSKN